MSTKCVVSQWTLGKKMVGITRETWEIETAVVGV